MPATVTVGESLCSLSCFLGLVFRPQERNRWCFCWMGLGHQWGVVASGVESLGCFIRYEGRRTLMKSILIRVESRRHIAGFCGAQFRKYFIKDQNMTFRLDVKIYTVHHTIETQKTKNQQSADVSFIIVY